MVLLLLYTPSPSLLLAALAFTSAQVIEAECDLYRQLALWEVDPARRHAMHKRRIDLIKPPIMELNEKAYTQLVRQVLDEPCSPVLPSSAPPLLRSSPPPPTLLLSSSFPLLPSSLAPLPRQGLFDISTIASEMLEIKVQMHAADPPVRRAKRLDTPVQLCVDSCTAFLSRFDDPEPPERVEIEQESAYIQCHFHRARAYSKLDTNPESLGRALKAYEMLAKYLTKNKVEGSVEEAKVCEEMASLLPMKIAQAQRAAAGPEGGVYA